MDRPFEVTLTPADMEYVVSSNERIHWSRRYEVQQFWRGFSLMMFIRKPHLERAHITATFLWPDMRRRDVHNYTALVVKPVIDGIVQAGVLPDDDDTHLVGPDLRSVASQKRFGLRVHVRPL